MDNFLYKHCELYVFCVICTYYIYVWFGTSINQENRFQSITPYFKALGLVLSLFLSSVSGTAKAILTRPNSLLDTIACNISYGRKMPCLIFNQIYC